MKEITIVSGKGGTGKTSIAASIAMLARNCVIADCDVDAADLHLILQPQIIERHNFIGGREAEILPENCSGCGICLNLCRFGALSSSEGFSIDPLACEGCGVCAKFCPESAIVLKDAISGEWFYSKTRMGDFVHAKLGPSGENSGKLVTILRKRAKLEAERSNADFIIVDGSPGIGCPVIASVTGADFAVIVTEPTVSGIHDLERIARLLHNFRMKSGIVINKYDINPEKAKEIKDFAGSNSIEVLGDIPYDRKIIDAQIACKALVEYADGTTAKSIEKIWERICQL